MFSIYVWRFLEELNVLGITPRPTALHVVHTKSVEFLGHAQFVCDRKTNPFALRAVLVVSSISTKFFINGKFPPRPYF